MPSASAQLLVAVDGGAPASGGQTTANNAATIALSAVSKVGWGNPPTRWQIASFPSGFSCPAGWSTVTTTIGGQSVTVYQYTGNSDPPSFALPGGAWWGKLLFRLVVLGGTTSTLVDELCGVEVRSPNGVRDIAFLEAGQFDAARRAVGPLQANLRKLEDALANGGGGASLTFTAVKTANYTAAVGDLVRVNATGGNVTIFAPDAAGHSGERWGVLRVEPTLPVAHTVTIDSADGVNDEGTYTMPVARSCVIMRSDGSTWRVETPALPYAKPSDATPEPTGTAAAGTSEEYARADHVHASSGGGGWQTGVEIADFGALTPQDIKSGGDGTYIIAGRSFTATNTTHAAYLQLDAAGLTGQANNGSADVMMSIPWATLAPAATLADHDVLILARLVRSTYSGVDASSGMNLCMGFEPFSAGSDGGSGLPSKALLATVDTQVGGLRNITQNYNWGPGQSGVWTGGDAAADVWLALYVAAGGRRFWGAIAAGAGTAPDPSAMVQMMAGASVADTTGPSGAWTPSASHLRLRWSDGGGGSKWSLKSLKVVYK